MKLDFSQQVMASDDVLIRVLDGEAVILDLESESYFGLDGMGTHMWTVLTEMPSIQDAYDQILTEYEVDEETLRAEMISFVNQLIEHNLITLEDKASA